MRLRHAAALALVGWYLMAPPRNGAEVIVYASMNQWENWSSYDSARECRTELDVWRSFPLSPGQNSERTARSADPGLDKIYAEERQMYNVVCIASDDPRLKGN